MRDITRFSAQRAVWLGLALALCAILLFIGGSTRSAKAGAPDTAVASPNAITCPVGQCFADVPPANGFFTTTNNLYMDGIVGGYPCGGPGEPCDSQNRPYYRPGNNVSRQQMTKFVDLGRRNIADAIGSRLVLTNPTQVALVISSTTTDSIDAYNSSGTEAIQAYCLRSATDCYAIFGYAETGDYAGYLSGGRGTYSHSFTDTFSGVEASASGQSAYGSSSISTLYRGAYAKANNTNFYGLVVDDLGSSVGAYMAGNVSIAGTLSVSGGCTGCLISVIAQNVGSAPIEVGDVVTVVGSGPALIGSNPTLLVKKADSAYDSSAAGIVGGAMYVPDAATRAAYAQQEADIKTATEARETLMSTASASDEKADPGQISIPAATITDAEGTVHSDASTTTIAPNSYASIMTGGTFQSLKVDASFGAIKTGDLLTTSSNPGYAMKVTDKSQALGAIIGKAMGDLSSGTGVVPVLITLK